MKRILGLLVVCVPIFVCGMDDDSIGEQLKKTKVTVQNDNRGNMTVSGLEEFDDIEMNDIGKNPFETLKKQYPLYFRDYDLKQVQIAAQIVATKNPEGYKKLFTKIGKRAKDDDGSINTMLAQIAYELKDMNVGGHEDFQKSYDQIESQRKTGRKRFIFNAVLGGLGATIGLTGFILGLINNSPDDVVSQLARCASNNATTIQQCALFLAAS